MARDEGSAIKKIQKTIRGNFTNSTDLILITQKGDKIPAEEHHNQKVLKHLRLRSKGI